MKSIIVSIGGREYPLKITEEEERMIHDTVREVNEKLSDLKLTYQNKDKQDCLSMALLTYALELKKLQMNETVDVLKSKTATIHQLLDQIIN